MEKKYLNYFDKKLITAIEELWKPVKFKKTLQDIWDEALKDYNEEKQFWQTIKNTDNGRI